MESSVYCDWLIDGTGGKVKQHVLISVKDGLITRINSELSEVPVAGVDCDVFERCTVVPAFVDCHTHLALSSTVNNASRNRALTYDQTKEQIKQNLHYHYIHGVLQVRDGGDRGGFVAAYLKEIDSLSVPVAVQSSGYGLCSTGRYGAGLGKEVTVDGLSAQFENISSEMGVVKIFQSGLVGIGDSEDDFSPQFSVDELSQAVTCAHGAGKRVMVHANGKEAVKIALDAGCDSIEHGFYMGDENLKVMAEKGVFWIPTVYSMSVQAEDLSSQSKNYNQIKRVVESQLQQLRLAKKYGVKVAVGTDAGSPAVNHGESFHEELKFLSKAGYSQEEAISCASRNGAELLGLQDFGILKVGMPATFLVAHGAPGMLKRKLAHLDAIYNHGKKVIDKYTHLRSMYLNIARKY